MISLFNRQSLGLGIFAGSILLSKVFCDSVHDVVQKDTGISFGQINSYQLLGTGVRQVTFLNFNAYAMGLYIQSCDLSNLSSRWTQEFTSTKLGNSPESEFYSSDLLKKGISLKLVIKTARNTDGPHLRNGFLKMLKLKTNQLDSIEKGKVEKDLDILKSSWPVKGSFKKGNSIVITRGIF